MDEFLLSIIDQAHVFVLMVALLAVFFYWGGRKTSTNLADPWMVQQAFSAFASATVVFMWWSGSIGIGITLYHVSAVIVFFLIASYHPPRLLARQRALRHGWRMPMAEVARLQTMVLWLLVISQLLMWSVTGLPILLPSRLDAAASGGGVGVLVRIAAVFTTVLIFLTVVRIGQRQAGYRPARDVLMLLTVLAIQVANASKSSIIYTALFFLTSDWLCARISRHHQRVHIPTKYVVGAVGATTGLALLPFVLENLLYTTSTSTNPFLQFGIRAILSGDTYIRFLGQGFLWSLNLGSPTLILLTDFLGSFRLVPRESLPLHPGLAVTRDLLPTGDSIAGVNMRVDLFGYMFGGWLQGLVFVALAAVVFNALRASVFYARRPTRILLAVYFFFSAPAVFIDPTLGMGVLLNALLSWPILAAMVFLSGSRRRKRQSATSARRRRTPDSSGTVSSSDALPG